MTFPFKILTYEKTIDKENTLEKCGLYPSLFIHMKKPLIKRIHWKNVVYILLYL